MAKEASAKAEASTAAPKAFKPALLLVLLLPRRTGTELATARTATHQVRGVQR